MLRVELPQSARRSEAHAPETVQGDGSFIDTLVSLLCGVLCNNEQYNKTVGKALSGNLDIHINSRFFFFFYHIAGHTYVHVCM